MQLREKILAGGFAAVLAFYFVPKVWSWFIEPVELAESALKSAKSVYQDREFQQLQVLAKQRQLKDWKGRSLSPKPQEAALQYQQWLTDLAEVVAEFSNAQVTPQATATAANQPFVTVRFGLKASATLAQVQYFLYRFYQADLLHSITLLNLDSPAATGNPKLTVTMQIEGLSLRDAPARGPTLFPRTEIAEDWQDPDEPLNVRHTEGFPEQPPFLIRAGKNYFLVNEVVGTRWTIAPDANSNSGKGATKQRISLLADEVLELAPIHPNFADKSLQDFEAILTRNPFIKPVPYAPKLEFIGAKSFSRGSTLDITCRASGFDLSAGEPLYSLEGDAPIGMILDSRSGKLTWKPDEDQELGDITLKVTVRAGGLKGPLSEPLKITLRPSNRPPKFESVGERHAVLGKEFVLKLKATDEDAGSQLKYSFDSDAPEGAKLDAETGELRWTPPLNMAPGPVKVTVQVADNGSPPNTVKQEITIVVDDDLAQFTELTGILEKGGQRELWLTDKARNRQIVLREGEALRYADIEASVVRIGKKAILLKMKDDTLWQLELGDTLKKLRKVEPAAVPETPKNSG
jgi:hypothetical protein